jgi:polysaccharide biosynthesis/export protein
MKLGVSATLLLAVLAVAPVAFAQDPAPRASTDSPATPDAAPTSTDSATPSSPADGAVVETPSVAPASASDTPALSSTHTPPFVPVVVTPTPTPTPTPVPTSIQLATAYEIGPEDVLEISVWKNPELSRTVPVRPDGKVSLPLVNDIQASGLTPIDLRDQVTAKLSEYIPAPEVSVIVREVHSRKVTVAGAVKLPGRYELKSTMTVLEVIALAQGLTDFASRDRIVILRQNGQKTERIPFNYRKISDAAQQDNFLIRPGDIVFVP